MFDTDRLFISSNCPDCAIIRAVLDMNAVMEDDFRGASGQKLHVYSALSNEATRELLDKYGLGEKNAKDEHIYYTPILVPSDGEKPLTKVKNIVEWLRKNGMTTLG